MSEIASDKSIFLHAAGLDSPAARAAYLGEACRHEPSIRARIDELLAAHDRLGGESPPTAGLEPAPAPLSGHEAGTVIGGRFKLLEVIGEGGMGSVWLAEQTEPVRRKVALKLIKPGMDSRNVLARFEAERQALALMDHPNIAKVLDGGATADGRPFFVMELVKGVPITKYCDEHHLTPKERLELFVPVCQAVQHAHQKGIIHRDLKPSNVLVAPYDGRPVTKVIDFGVAKAAGQQLTEKTLFTGLGAVVGTLEYMSPEQAELNNQDIDTRSDIYSLGVLLYELLTGSTPLTSKRLKEAAFMEMLRMIREEEPPKPSTRLSDSTDSLPSISAQRHTEPAKLTKLVRGELDWIVMKALEKDRSRRYETANGFAADIQRYLVDEPVQACPPSAGYRLRKFARRNKGPVATGAVILLTLLGGIVGTTFGLLRAERARQAEAERADAESRAKLEAEDREAETRAMLDFVEHGILVARMVEPNPGTDRDEKAMLRRAVGEALPFVDRFKDRPLIEARLRLTLGAAFNSLNEHALAAQQVERARSLYEEHRGPAHPDTLMAIHSLAQVYANVGRAPDALKLFGEMWERQRDSLGQDHADTLATRLRLADTHYANQPAEGLKLCKEILSLLAERKAPLEPGHSRVLAVMAAGPHIQSQPEEGIKLLEQILAVQQTKLSKDHPDTLATMKTAAQLYAVFQRDADALKMSQDMLVIQRAKPGREHPEAIETMLGLANVHLRLKQYEDALKLCQEVLAIIRKDKPGRDDHGTLMGMHQLPDRFDADGRGSEGLRLREELLTVWKSRFPANVPETLAIKDKVADSYTALGRHADALKLHEEALKGRKAEFNAEPLDTVVRTRDSRYQVVPMLRSMTGMADNYAALGRNAEAEAHYGQALELYKVLLTRKDEQEGYLPHIRHLAAMTAAKLGEVQLLGTRKAEEAEARFAEAVKLCDCPEVYCRIGSAYARHSQWKKAADAFRTALARNPKYAAAYGDLAQALRKQGKVAEAIDAFEKAIELEPKNAAHHNNLGGMLCDDLREYDKAIERFRKAIELDPKLANARQGLGIALGNKSLSLVSSPDPKARDPKGAIEAAREAIELDPRSSLAWQYLGWVRYRAGDWPASIEALEKSCKLQSSRSICAQGIAA